MKTDLYMEWAGKGKVPLTGLSSMKRKWFRWVAITPHGPLTGEWIKAK